MTGNLKRLIGEGVWQAAKRALWASPVPAGLLLLSFPLMSLFEQNITSEIDMIAAIAYVLLPTVLLLLLWALLAAAAHCTTLAENGLAVPALRWSGIARFTWTGLKVLSPPMIIGFGAAFVAATATANSEEWFELTWFCAGLLIEVLTVLALVRWGTALPAAVVGGDIGLAAAQRRSPHAGDRARSVSWSICPIRLVDHGGEPWPTGPCGAYCIAANNRRHIGRSFHFLHSDGRRHPVAGLCRRRGYARATEG
jgi:hypothetical protein